MSGHTPGPWHVSEPHFGQMHVGSDYSVGGVLCVNGKQHICSLPSESKKKGSAAYHEMFLANARLIAAAPTMLALMKEVSMRVSFDDETREIENRIDSLLEELGEKP